MSQKDRIMKDLRFFTGLGHRRTGTENNLKSARYIAQRFLDLGMSNVTIEHADTSARSYSNWSLIANGEEIPCYFINGSLLNGKRENHASIDAELIYLDDGLASDFAKADVKGKIVIANVKWIDYTLDDFRDRHSTGEICVYDEGNSVKEGETLGKDTYTPNTFPQNYVYAMENGAAGFIGILAENFDHTIHFNEDYNYMFEMGVSEEAYGIRTDIQSMELPGLWVSRSNGEKLKRILSKHGTIKGKITLSVNLNEEKANVVYGKLPGKSTDVIIVHSHHDSVFEGAVQDGAAMSCVLEVARYFAEKPAGSLEKTLMFLATDTHYTDYEGHENFIKKRLAEGDNIILDVSLEHIGKEALEAADGSFEITGRTGLKLLYVTENELLLETVRKAAASNRVDRSIVLPVNHRKGYVCSDSTVFHEYGIPVASLIAPVSYLMDPVDTIEMVDQDMLEPVTNYATDIVERIMNSGIMKIKEEPCKFNGKRYEKANSY